MSCTRWSVVVLLTLFVGTAQLWAGDEEEPKKKPEETKKIVREKGEPVVIEGQLADTDPPDAQRNHPCKLHRVALKKGKSYVIDLVSKDFDSYLRLEDADGNTLAENDDGGEMLNSRINFTPKKDGNFQLVATTFGGGAGNYRLTVRETNQKPFGQNLGKAVTIGEDGLTINGKLDNNDSISPVDPKNACKLYSIKMKAKETYIIDLESNNFDAYLHVLDKDMESLASDDDGGGNLNSRITFRPTADGTYHVLATSLNRQLGAFTLRVRKENADSEVKEKEPGENPGKVVEIGDKGLKINGKLDNNDPKSPVEPMNPSKVYSVKLKAKETYIIDLESKMFDAFLHVLDKDMESLASDDDGGGNLNSRITFRPTADGTYQLLATSLNGRLGNFTLKVRKEAADGEDAPKAFGEKLGKVLDVGADGLNINGKLTNTDPKAPVDPKNACKVFGVKMKANETYVIDLESGQFDAYLHVLENKTFRSLASDDDSGGNLNSRITFRPTEDGTYLIVATSLNNRVGDFTLRVQKEKE